MAQSKNWQLLPNPNSETVVQVAKQLSIPEINAFLLAQRGVENFEQAKSFFRPQMSELHDPFLMKDMDKAIARIENAIANQENILVYGDYDVDGTTAVSIVYSFFSSFYENIHYYIPDRYKEGYGVSKIGIDFAADNDFGLIICLDCGIRAIDTIAYAKQKEVDFIVCDHHLPGEVLPDAVAILDPKQNGCEYPYKELSGAGIGYKLIDAYATKNGIQVTEVEKYLDLVCVSIAADIVDMTGENKVLSYYGLLKLNSKPSLGLKTLLALNERLPNQLTITDVVFKISPKINAAGRIKSGMAAVKLLIAKDFTDAEEIAFAIQQYNSERQGLDKQITAEALSIIENDTEFDSNKSTVVFEPHWHKGVVGIVASRLIEKHYRPTIVLTEAEGMLTGSARSVEDFSVYNAINKCNHLLEQFGGHNAAAGLSLKPENLEQFKTEFNTAVTETITEEQLIPTILIDTEIELDAITPKFYRIVKQMAPFGPKNLPPTFATHNLVAKSARIVGENHLKLDLEANGEKISCIGFNLGQHITAIQNKQPFSICYHIEENFWNGKTTLQLNLKDLKMA